MVLESPADSAEEPELRPASSQAFRDQDLEDAGVAVAAQFFDGSMTLPLRQTELAGDLLYGGLVQFRALGEVFTTPAFDHRGAAAAGVIGPFPAGEPHSDGCARERSFRR